MVIAEVQIKVHLSFLLGFSIRPIGIDLNISTAPSPKRVGVQAREKSAVSGADPERQRRVFPKL
jgi:hypothetical protein